MPSRFPLVHSSVKSRALKGLCLRANEGALSRGPPALLVFLFFSSFDEAAYTFPLLRGLLTTTEIVQA